MWETRSIQLKVRLPRELAQQAEEVQESDPEFLNRLVLYGLTRRTVFRQLREQEEGGTKGPDVRSHLPV